MDLNYDNECNDMYYSQQKVSQNPPVPGTAYIQSGFYGLSNPNATPGTQAQKDDFLFNGKVMVWSAGPDKQYDPVPTSGAASPPTAGFNKDNILSWQ
jgi:hypothetical protein